MSRTGRFLVVTYDGGGNGPPTMGIARALRERGHGVTVLGNPVQKAQFEGTGFPFAAYEASPPWEWATPGFEARGSWFTEQPTLLEDVKVAIARSRPDALLVDFLLTPALVAAELAGLPTAVLVHTLAAVQAEDLAGWMRARRPSLELRPSLGLPTVGTAVEHWAQFSLCLVAALPALDHISASTPVGFHHVGPILDGDSEPDAWVPPWPAGDPRPLVLVSLTTRFDRRLVSMLQAVLDGLADAPVRVLVTTGLAIDPSALAPPGNAVVAQLIPHSHVLPHASVVITHAGHGTAMAALAHSLPLACIPLFADQPIVAARIAEAGAGRVLAWDADPEEIRDAVQTLLTDPHYREAAVRLATLISQQGGAAKAADLLETLLA